MSDTYAHNARETYRANMAAANLHYSATGDLAGYQAMAATARDTWHANIASHYANPTIEAAYRAARDTYARVYAHTITGETVSVPTLAALYHVTDTTGAPAEPLIARIIGDFTGSNLTTVPIGRA